MKKLKKIVLICLFCIMFMGLIACMTIEMEIQQPDDTSVTTPITEENFTTGNEENLSASEEENFSASEEENLSASEEENFSASEEENLSASEEENFSASEEESFSASNEENLSASEEEILSEEAEENLTVSADINSVNWNEILSVPAEEAANEANPEYRMAHNVYSDPDLSATSGKFDGFSIDFKADETGMATYWSLCNWQMNKDDLKSRYEVIDEYAGAYAGLQMRADGPKAIMSFWEINYIDESGNEAKIQAERIYPSGEETNQFGGEGEGSNYICDYEWEEGKWYRMYLNCYRDENGRTFVEQWVADLSTGEWTLISCFDTGLYNSYFEGGMSQFMENYDSNYANETRTFEYCNICVKEYGKSEWTPILSADLSVDTWWDNKKGDAAYGATENCFYGIANGYGPDAFELNEVAKETFTIEPAEDFYGLEWPALNGVSYH